MQVSSVDEGLASGAQVQQLRDLVASKESVITSNQARIARLEALHKLAQDSALKCEAELVSCHEGLSKAEEEKQRLRAEVHQSKYDTAHSTQNLQESCRWCLLVSAVLSHAFFSHVCAQGLACM
jgi:hypothetical protein